MRSKFHERKMKDLPMANQIAELDSIEAAKGGLKI